MSSRIRKGCNFLGTTHQSLIFCIQLKFGYTNRTDSGRGNVPFTAVESCVYVLNGTQRGKPELKCGLRALWDFSSHLLARHKDRDGGDV